MEKATEDFDSNELVDKVISNVEKSKDQTEHKERNAAEVETVLEENESEEELEGEESNSRDEVDGPKTHGKTEGSPLKLAVGRNLMGRTKELIKEAKELVGAAEETENKNAFVGSVICAEDSDDSTFTLHNDVIEGKLGNAGEDHEISDEQCEKEIAAQWSLDTRNQRHTEEKSQLKTQNMTTHNFKFWGTLLH